MIEKINGIKIKGKCFLQDTSLEFFKREGKQTRLALVYGRNGSGKSAIASGFRTLSSGLSTENSQASSTSQDHSTIVASLLQESEGSAIATPIPNIHVFDEKYVDKNVKVQTNGLGTIVLIGTQVELQDKIQKCELEISQLCGQPKSDSKERKIGEIEKLEQECQEYSTVTNPIAPAYYRNEIMAFLRDKDWAKIDAKLKGNKVNSQVRDTVVTEICTIENKENKSIDELATAFEGQMILLEKLREVKSGFPQEIEQISFREEDEAAILKALAVAIDKPALTDREKIILDAVQNGSQRMIEEAKERFQQEDTHYCPYCFREISNDYKVELVANIGRVLNRDVDDHKKCLKSLSLPELSTNYDIYEDLDSLMVTSIKRKISECQDIIDAYRELIQKKIDNVYIPIITKSLGLYKKIKAINAILFDLNIKRIKFNKNLQNKKAIQNSAIYLNKLIAHENVKQWYKDYLGAKEKKEKVEAVLASKKARLQKVKERLIELQQQKANTRIAVDKINWGLNYVFFSKDRLALRNSDGAYSLLSNGYQVKPSDVSVGERNIIALCYFFTEIFANQEETKLYKNELLVVVDDPISSFDIENRVGIMSFLRLQINKILKGNSNSKFLLMTHDLVTYYDLVRAAGDLCKNSNINFSCWELTGEKLGKLKNVRSEYEVLLDEVFDYAACNVNAPDTHGIGNMMRRMLEAFSTFVYQKSPNEVICSPAIVEALGEKSNYYENRMFRIVLNNESHAETQIKTLESDGAYIDYFTDAEKKQTAKDILSFIYAINRQHLEAYVKDKNKISIIKKWYDTVPKNQ
jgi:wobble nucleotide-excising tRNase